MVADHPLLSSAGTDNEAQGEARKTMARLEQIAAQEYGFEYADDLHERELGGKRV